MPVVQRRHPWLRNPSRSPSSVSSVDGMTEEHHDDESAAAELGGQTAAGSGEARTLGHGTSGGDDYTAINPGGTSVAEEDEGLEGAEE